ncbi:MAG: tetratricopeptide repeat protein [Isosphaeraceae bacterium]
MSRKNPRRRVSGWLGMVGAAFGGGLFTALALVWSPGLVLAADGPEEARRLWQNGRYDEALEAYDALAKTDAAKAPPLLVKVTLGRADCLASQGESTKAAEAVQKALDGPAKDNPDLLARLAELRFVRGDWVGARTAVEAALKASPDHIAARWIDARLLEASGELDKALDAWKWFVDAYNARAEELGKDADTLIIIGQASERYYRARARGDELAESLNDVINEIYERALKVDPLCWQAPWLEGRLFLAGYNEGKAIPELTRALQINPLAAEVLVTLGQADLQGYKLAAGRAKAERALRVNPHYAPAYVLLADLNISDERFTDAKEAATKAAAENPRDEDALARLAASCRLLVDPFGAATAESAALANNPRPATFYAALGERLADRRKYPGAERAFLLAMHADPRRADAPIGLGMLYMQIGRETEAKSLFDAAFSADPFNVRAYNQMEVLKHMAAYSPVASPHFSVVIDPKQDALLSKYMSRYLESIYPELTQRFAYAPPGLTQIEIMTNHKWFSARTIGLPFIPTVGACTGTVVALASPRATAKPFNWARVLKHELVHVITLQQTAFNIPHWYTEALAVESEGFPRPQEWNKMLLDRVPNRKKLLNLDTINLGFIRPNEPDDRQMAYCQAQLYAQYMLQRFGPDALQKMLDAYRRGLTTDRAVKACFNVEKADFEAKYLEFLDGVVKTIRTRVDEEQPVKFSQLTRQLQEKPDDPDLNARMAYEHFARRDFKEARPFADKALAKKPNHPLASYVKARLFTSIGDDDAALAVLRPALDPARPNERVIDLLGQLEMKAGRLDEAERLYELARKDDPYHSKWIANLARVHLRKKENAKFLTDLSMLADNDADDIDIRKVLAEKLMDAGQPERSEKWAYECLYIDVYDPEAHALLASALAAQNKHEPAVEEYEAALGLKLKPRRAAELKVKLAESKAALGKKDDARKHLDEILKEDPEHPEAKALRKKLD